MGIQKAQPPSTLALSNSGVCIDASQVEILSRLSPLTRTSSIFQLLVPIPEGEIYASPF